MDRALLVALAAAVVVLVGAIGAAIGLAMLSGDPAMMVQRNCSGQRMGPPGGCRNLRITARTQDRVEYTYDTGSGYHCTGYLEVRGRGPFLFGGSASSGGTTCGPQGQPLGPPPGPPPPPTPFADGSPPCSTLVYGAPVATGTGFEVTITNGGGGVCDVTGPAKLVVLDSRNMAVGVTDQPSTEPSPLIRLAPGGSARLDFDTGSGPCVAASSIVVLYSAPARPMPWPHIVCGPITSHPATT